jgi:hypothetical protein
MTARHIAKGVACLHREDGAECRVCTREAVRLFEEYTMRDEVQGPTVRGRTGRRDRERREEVPR